MRPLVDRSLGLFLLPWGCAALFDIYLSFGSRPRPSFVHSAGQVLLFLLAGRSQWRLARGTLRSLLVPSAVVLFFACLPLIPKDRFAAGLSIVGATTILWLALKATRPFGGSLLAGMVAAGASVLIARVVDQRAVPRPDVAVGPSLVRSLAWPAIAGTTTSAPRGGQPPIVIVSVDTLRADAARRMKAHDLLARRGASWTRAMSTSSWTLPALASLQTGLQPNGHGAACVDESHCQGMFPDTRTLAQDLRERAYTTAAVVENAWIDPGTGFDRGFDSFVGFGVARNRLLTSTADTLGGRTTVDTALEWLATAPHDSFYLWVHLFGPHMPYAHASDERFRKILGPDLRSGYPLSLASRRALRAAYDEEVEFTDQEILRLFGALEKRGIFELGIVVLTSDHGEEFWEHGGVEHGHSHHGEVLDIPLAMVAPGLTAGNRDDLASIVDIASTIRALLGIPTSGIDLRRPIPADRIALAWGGLVVRHDCSARTVDRRVILRDCSTAPHDVSLYDLRVDPNETSSAPAGTEDRLVVAASGILAPAVGSKAAIDRQRLRAIGYIGD